MNMGQMSISSYFSLQIPWEKLIEFFPFPFMFLASSKLLQATQLWMHQQRVQGALQGWWDQQKGTALEQNTSTLTTAFCGRWPVPAGSKDVTSKRKYEHIYFHKMLQKYSCLCKKHDYIHTFIYRKWVCANEVHWKMFEKIYASKYFIVLNFAKVVVYLFSAFMLAASAPWKGVLSLVLEVETHETMQGRLKPWWEATCNQGKTAV